MVQPPRPPRADISAQLSARWHVRLPNGSEFGPLSEEELRQLIQQNIVTANCQVRPDGNSDWSVVGPSPHELTSRTASVVTHAAAPPLSVPTANQASEAIRHRTTSGQPVEPINPPPVDRAQALDVANQRSSNVRQVAESNHSSNHPKSKKPKDSNIDWDNPYEVGGAIVFALPALFVTVALIGLKLHLLPLFSLIAITTAGLGAYVGRKIGEINSWDQKK